MNDTDGPGMPAQRVDLSGQVGVVTGGNGGIGLGMAQGLAAAGADVVIWARDAQKNAAAVDSLSDLAPGQSFGAFQCDVSDPGEVASALERTVGEFGRIDACIANAGTTGGAAFLDLSPEEWRRVMSVNLDGVFFTIQAAARQMVSQGEGGALVVTSSTSSVHGAPMTAHYASSKTAVLGLARSAAVALARHAIRVNALVPGWAVTDLARGLYENDRFREATVKRTPVRRWGSPEDFSAVAAYLCDKSVTYHTGDTVTVDGGYTVF
ncbi:MAG: SDR family NAD(P)-dependent oxidoreductase [Microthrixaceae bacterium]